MGKRVVIVEDQDDYCNAADIAAAMAVGFDRHVSKPASPEALDNALLSARASVSAPTK